jgi:hypothetical protein
MNVAKGVVAAVLLLAATLPTTTASAQEGNCIVISGIGAVSSGPDCSLESGSGSTVMITLQGSIDIVTHDLANRAIVSCWVCEAGSCGTNSAYGPSKTEWSLSATGSNRSLVDWVVPFRFSDYALSNPTTSFPSLASYYCRLELEYRPLGADAGNPGPPTVPEVFANHPHARTEQNSPLVVELQGTFPQAVSTRRNQP